MYTYPTATAGPNSSPTNAANFVGTYLPNSVTGAGFTTQRNSSDTSWITPQLAGGYRFDWGYIENDRGWLFSAFEGLAMTQTNAFSNVSMVYNDPGTTVYNAWMGSNITASGSFVEVTPGAITNFPLLNGFISYGATTASFGGVTLSVPADLNGNNLYGYLGRDLGGAFGTTSYSPPLDGIPNPETGTPGAQSNLSPGAPYNGAVQPVDYGDAVPLPVLFNTVNVLDSVKFWGIEANRLLRASDYDRFGGLWELFSGIRYFSFQENFQIDAKGGILADSFWNTTSYNRIVGPQIGVRWSKQRERLKFSLEGRGMAGANFMTGRQDGYLGTKLSQLIPLFTTYTDPTTTPPTTVNLGTGGGPNNLRVNQPLMLSPTSFNSAINWVDFSPVAEVRAKMSYQLFRSVSFNIGYTGIWVGNVARAPDMMNWTLPNFGVVRDTTHQSFFVNGLTVGVEVNR
jgi:hypothetical protein